jgi:addiction module RelE/StbE family toxin
MVKIVWTEQSVLDLKDILDYISKDSRRYAEDQIRRIKSKTLILKTQPESGRIVPELGIIQIRELIEGNYRIVYRLLNNELIEILTIHHSARDFESREIEKIK